MDKFCNENLLIMSYFVEKGKKKWHIYYVKNNLNVKETKLIKSDNLFPVVGIGASAGGLDAFKKLIKAIPENSGMAFVLVQHLDPNHDSMLPELLQKVTNIPVLEIADDIKVEPNHIYVIPSNKMMIATDGVLLLGPRPEKKRNELNLPIDLFFTSLAEVHQAHAIGVVLSGTANDGTLGLKAIKDHGGITFAQDELSAAYEGMPRSAAQAGVVDFILSPEKIPEKILEINKSINGNGDNEQDLAEQDEWVFKQIISLLRIRKGTDFTYYKQTTIRRRILRRMALNKNDKPAAYLKYLRENKSEQDILYQDLLIPVTSFFRDDKTFDNLCETVFPLIVKNKIVGDTLRFWIAGCSTGEEAFSIAICLKEFLRNNQEKVQIFATDISEPAIAKARSGVYSKNEVNNVTAQRLNEFFTKTNSGYRVNKEIRDMCVFAVHNFLKDPPLGRMDFISCRNVLIYMEPYLQKKALTTFHYSLNPKGFLLLGKSETISGVPEHFASAAKHDKLFSRKDIPGRFIHVVSPKSEQDLSSNDAVTKTEPFRSDFQKTADDILLSKYTPAGVVVNELMDIVHFRGNTSSYLEQSSGKPSHNLLKMAKQGLAFELRNIIHKTKKEKKSVKKENILLQINDNFHNISIEAIPLPNTIEPYYLILFHDTNSDDKNVSLKNKKNTSSIKNQQDDKDLRIQQLELELAQIREDIRSITEDQEATNEELQSANEELLSGSEELQSLNEELETNKEELQSTNEELTVINHEMVGLNEQVTEERDYSQAIIATIHEPMLILDETFHIKSANKSFYTNFHVTEAETKGVLLYDLGNKQWNIPRLRKLLEDIIPKNLQFHDFEIKHHFPEIGEKIMLLNASRIIQKSQGEQLILLAIHDITETRARALKLQQIEKELLKKDITETKIEKERLEKAVKERTKELIQANKELVIQYLDKEKKASELIIANKKLAYQNEEKEKRAEELLIINKELSAFTYIASHDLQEPLRKTQLFISRIFDSTEQTLSEKNMDYFKRIQASANRMQVLINDILDYSRVTEETEKTEKFKKADLNSIVQNVLHELTLAETIEETKTNVIYGKLPEIQGIPFQLKQLFTNLINNSIKYRAPGRAPVIDIQSSVVNGADIENTNANASKEYYKITVADNGIGFEQQYAERIFTLFQRLHDKQAFSGTGIGLTICKRITENHNGFITATGIPNQGATFAIYFPVV